MLCLPDGSVLGALPPFRVDVPWWPEVGPVVAAARAVHGVEITILRLLVAEPGRAMRGGPVTYLAEVERARRRRRSSRGRETPTADEPLRLSYARPGGSGDDLAWADAGAGRTRDAADGRRRSRCARGTSPASGACRSSGSAAWLKVVPPFFAHESRDARAARSGRRAAH